MLASNHESLRGDPRHDQLIFQLTADRSDPLALARSGLRTGPWGNRLAGQTFALTITPVDDDAPYQVPNGEIEVTIAGYR
jgi:hypothetical protein